MGWKTELSFQKLKSHLTTAPVLHFPKWDQEFWIEIDASNVGLRVILIQWNKDGEDQEVQLLIAYTSQSLKTTEKNYSTTNQEGLAIVWAVKHFKAYIMGMHFKIITDHNILKAL